MFLHNILEKDVYMKHPPRFKDLSMPHHHCKLDNALYGLKQARCVWYSWLSLKLQTLSCIPSKAEHIPVHVQERLCHHIFIGLC
jgi:hypothetical protein